MHKGHRTTQIEVIDRIGELEATGLHLPRYKLQSLTIYAPLLSLMAFSCMT